MPVSHCIWSVSGALSCDPLVLYPSASDYQLDDHSMSVLSSLAALSLFHFSVEQAVTPALISWSLSVKKIVLIINDSKVR